MIAIQLRDNLVYEVEKLSEKVELDGQPYIKVYKAYTRNTITNQRQVYPAFITEDGEDIEFFYVSELVPVSTTELFKSYKKTSSMKPIPWQQLRKLPRFGAISSYAQDMAFRMAEIAKEISQQAG